MSMSSRSAENSRNVNIVFVHLLDTFTGSPKVLADSIAALNDDVSRPVLYLGSGGDGFLEGVEIRKRRYWYRRSPFRFLTFFYYIFSQIRLLLKLLRDRSIDPSALVYVNSLLPFGAALFGVITGRPVVYHVHELSIPPNWLNQFLRFINRRSSQLNLFVSRDHAQRFSLGSVKSLCIYNGIGKRLEAAARAAVYEPLRRGKFRVVMLSSIRNYKGVCEFLRVARLLQAVDAVVFELVASDETPVVAGFFRNRDCPPNLTIQQRISDPGEVFERASLVVNLSRVDLVVETFGLTLLEAMAFGVPVVAPPVGGPSELVRDGKDGYLIDSRSVEVIADRIVDLSRSPELCRQLSISARRRAAEFSQSAFESEVRRAIALVRGRGER